MPKPQASNLRSSRQLHLCAIGLLAGPHVAKVYAHLSLKELPWNIEARFVHGNFRGFIVNGSPSGAERKE